MRVIAGSARGIKLHPFEGREIRPTLDRVRESLFNIFGPAIEGATFLDCFAGTGANGIEALSRGADTATFVERDRAAADLIRKNLVKARLETSARILELTLPKDTDRVSGNFDYIFADPPHDFPDYEALLVAIGECGLLAEDGVLVVEHSRRLDLPDQAATLERTRHKVYGDTALSFYA